MSTYKLNLFLVLLFIGLNSYAVDYYWIGGSGNWGDLNHWATASGNGSVLHNKTPGSGDDVYIDANSLNGFTDTIVMNVQTAFCRSFTINNIGGHVTIIFQNSATLRLFGSIDFDDATLQNATIICESAILGRTVKTQNTYISNLSFSSIGGGWTLLDSLNAGYIGITAGNFVSKFNYVQCQSFDMNGGVANLDTVHLTTSYISLTGGNVTMKRAKLYISSSSNFSNINSFQTDFTTISHTGYAHSDYVNNLHDFDTIRFYNYSWPSIQANSDMFSKVVSFANDGTLSGNWKTDSLALTPSKVYHIGQGSAITIKKIRALGDCQNWINIECATRAGTGTLNFTSANTASYIRFRNIVVTGSAFTVNPHIKIGTVTGVLGIVDAGKKMYWVGGDGHWKNPQHWSLTDGGLPVGCVPGPLDSVYFTNLSGSTAVQVEFGDSVVQFHSIFCSNSTLPISFSGNNKPIQAMGSIVFTPQVTWSVSKKIALYGAATTYLIQTSSQPISFLSLLGGGTWTLVDTLNGGTLSIVHGQLYARNKGMELYYLVDNLNEWQDGFRVNDVPKLNIISGLVRIKYRVELHQASFILFADTSRVNCDADVNFYTINPTLQWNIVEWTNNLGVAYLDGNLKRIRQLILRSETEDNSDLIIDTLSIFKGNTYRWANSVKFFKINALGECNKRIVIRSVGALTNWEGFGQTNHFYFGLFEDVQFTMGTLNAYNSFDLANNNGINFISGANRTLYWVGSSGEWDDSTHWSLTSGGLGGECIPTPADSVVFDNNSSTGNMEARISTISFARDLMMFNTTFQLKITNSGNISPSARFEIFGNVHLAANLNFALARQVILKPDIGLFRYKSNNSYIPILIQEGTAVYRLSDTLKLGEFHKYAGTFHADTNHVQINYFAHYGGLFTNYNTTMSIGQLYSNSSFWYPGCDVTIGQNASFSGQVNSKAAKLLFTSSSWPSFTTSSIDTISTVIFIHPLGRAQVSIVNSHVGYIHFYGWAYLNSGTSVDTCVMTNGNSYFFNPSYNHRVFKYWDVDGDFCNPILLRSQVQGVKAPVYANDTVSGDFLEVRDLNFLGTSVFYTGEHSVNQGNNSGFIWTNKPGYIFGLGLDRFHLECNPFNPTGTLLTTENFQDATGYLWNDGSTGSSLNITTSGIYWCTADYITCQVTDTIEVVFNSVIIPIADSTVFCGPQTLNLTLVDTAIENRYTYLWNTGDTTNSITFSFYADTTLIFWIYDSLGTVCNETIHLYLLNYDYSPKELNLLNCAPEDLEPLIYQYLNIPVADSSIFDWSAFDSLTNSYYDVLRFTLYYDSCEVDDSINLRYDNPFPIIPNDSLLCEGSTVTFRLTNPIPAFNYLWSTGESSLTIKRKITSDGQVHLLVTDDLGRTCSDTVTYKMGNPVRANASPKFVQGIQPLTALFVGTKVQADASYWVYNGDTISSSDTLEYQFIKTGTHQVFYYAVNTNTGCFAIDTVTIEITENAVAWIPSAFTPNGDGTNDFWEFTIGDHIQGPILFFIVNRWGEKIYYTTERHIQWDGYFNGKLVQESAFIYVLQYGSAITPMIIRGTVVVYY